MDTMMTFKNDNLCKFLTKEEMRRRAPHIFDSAPTNNNVSARYVFANTETIIDDMQKLGWGVVDCQQQRANKRTNMRSFHMVALQNPNISIRNRDDNGVETIECFPRIIMQTSHDGFHSFKFMIGLFRCVCSNGLVISTDTFSDISIRHINYTFEELRSVVAKAIAAVEVNIPVMNDMKNTILNDDDKTNLAMAALRIRNKIGDDKDINVNAEDIDNILTPIREEDEGDDLWSVFNVLQEKLIKGNYFMPSNKNGKMRKARMIKGISRNIEINQNLFKEAVSFRKAS